MSDAPLVSVGMSVYNNAPTLAATIRSLQQQTHANWELLLIDDGSTDETPDVARAFNDPRIRVFADGHNRGLPARLNEAIEHARGDYFARLDGDDIAYPDRFAKQLAYLIAHRGIDLLGTAAVVFRAGGEVVGFLGCVTEHEQIVRKPWNGFNDLIHPTWMGKTEWFRAHRFDAGLRKAQDRDILLRSYRTSRFACLAEPLIGYRQETLDLKKMVKSRLYYMGILRRTAMRYRDPAFVWGILVQLAKTGVDVIAVTTGLRYRILRHRARPVPAGVRDRWQQVWLAVR